MAAVGHHYGVNKTVTHSIKKNEDNVRGSFRSSILLSENFLHKPS